MFPMAVVGPLWWRCDTLCTSGFVQDVMFAHNGQDWATRNILEMSYQVTRLQHRSKFWCLWLLLWAK